MNAFLAILGLFVAFVVIVFLAFSSASASAASAASAVASAQATGAVQVANALSCALVPFALLGAASLGVAGVVVYARLRGWRARPALPQPAARPVIVRLLSQALPGAQPAQAAPEARAITVVPAGDDDGLLDGILSRW